MLCICYPNSPSFFGLPLDQIVAMGSSINGQIHSVSTLVLFSLWRLSIC